MRGLVSLSNKYRALELSTEKTSDYSEVFFFLYTS